MDQRGSAGIGTPNARSFAPPVTVDGAAGLRDAMLAAEAILVPGTRTSTAGIHVAGMLQQLGIANAVAARLKIFPSGATAMRHLPESDSARPIG
jgi:molybdate transport system substrate-binding protein